MNLLDLNDDILNIIGVYVKKDNLERKIRKDNQIKSDKQIINGKVNLLQMSKWDTSVSLRDRNSKLNPRIWAQTLFQGRHRAGDQRN